jgi:ATP-dependent helicase/nuclease subunit B
LQVSEQTRFIARSLTESLQDFIETAVGWMRGQYQFDPAAVEIPFGGDNAGPAWELDVGDNHRLALHGRIDRVDVGRDPESGEALGVVIDYKSSAKQLDPTLVAHGVQLQLLAYLNVLRQWPGAAEWFGAAQLLPAGVFYVNLRGRYEREPNRDDALAEVEVDRKYAYQHCGRFDRQWLRLLDARDDSREGDQFNYRLNQDGSIHKGCLEPLAPEDFSALLRSTEETLRRMGRAIFSGAAGVVPYRKGAVTACEHCGYQSICRIDPWTHRYRALLKPAKGAA